MTFLKKAGLWLQKSKIISKVANALGSAGVPYASDIGRVSGTLGFGRPHHRTHRRRASRRIKR
jgi:hypothetical protein